MKCFKPSLVFIAALLVMFAIGNGVVLAAQDNLSFDSFAGTYYLDRNSQGVATLTSQEDMVVSFASGSNLYGITRSIPAEYQGHNLDLKVISVTDSLNNPVQYKTSSDGQGNEVIQTGDPAITLSGVQTYRIKYQTAGVASFYPDHDEFLVDVNGRGWATTFGSVKAFINLAPAFSASLINKPTCYIGYLNQTSSACAIKTEPSSGGQLVTASANSSLSAHQALVIKLDFKKDTFQQIKPAHAIWPLLAAGAVVFGAAGLWLLGWVLNKSS